MPQSYGYRANTRHKFRRPFGQSGLLEQRVFLRSYKIGQYVDVAVNGAIHKGMPHKTYHGRTGRIYNVTPRAVGIVLNKKVGHRIIAKKIHARIEHVKPSSCQDAFKNRVTQNDKNRKEKVKAPRKRQPAQPVPAHFVNVGNVAIETITPARYVFTI